jgi:anti-sigma regulatory factor (Ser/Thr protein kinase)
MSGVRARGEDIRRFILEQVERHPDDISRITAAQFGITRQAVNKHLQRLAREGALTEAGNTRGRTYSITPLTKWTGDFQITPELAEDLVWTNDVKRVIGQLPDNVLNIWHHGFTEMFNNAIDHSEGTRITVVIDRTAIDTHMIIIDNGIGIFKKIQTALNLLDERHAILELSKGKLTTDPRRHSGEGIFFTSRMFDNFSIHSGGVWFSHEYGLPEDWIGEKEKLDGVGTAVFMKLHNHTSRTTKKVFDEYASGEDFGFTKTVVPVKLAQYGNDQLISRSQAKRLLARVELFRTVLFDFTDVPSIGQAFADEIFRVFANEHPTMDLHPINASSEVNRMIDRVRGESVGNTDQRELPLT